MEEEGGYPWGGIRARKRHRSLNLAAILFPAVRCAEFVPLYSLGQNSRNEKYIPTSIANWNLHFLTKSFNRGFQQEEGVVFFPGKSCLPAQFNGITSLQPFDAKGIRDHWMKALAVPGSKF